MSTVRAAVVGVGDVSVVHLDAIVARAGSTLVAIADRDPVRREAAAEAWGVPGYADVESLLETEAVDVVHVCTPHDQHEPVATAVLASGASVLVEKPLADSPAAARRLAEAAEHSAGILGVTYQNRYNAASQAAKALLERGDLGAVLGASAVVHWHRAPAYYEAAPWRGTWAGGGGGLLMNQAIHTLDLVLWLLGPAARVDGTASTRVLGDVIEVEDTADVRITHESGATSILSATNAHVRNAPVRIEIVTEHAVLHLEQGLTITHADGRVERVDEPPLPTGPRGYWGVSHQLLVDAFHGAVERGEPFWIDASEGLPALDAIAAVYDQSFPHRPQTTQGGSR
ncbi:Gfo/Idh/MocA family protein [Agrococcus jejuensis]|uniref:Predicted dehydrogenase n=1 Tax=Agrococcus jejuensis TaxID=399736 RepID=A0A1G8DUT0_9MICO|nr:Gfo/Idh/MocA family oxidoreductase [Agrococcus jejuensis]SDH61464.1 Predicted dehydrogenase [Agrococcus jejuensis]